MLALRTVTYCTENEETPTTSILSCVCQAGGSGATALPANVAALNAQERQELIELRRKLRQVQMGVAIENGI